MARLRQRIDQINQRLVRLLGERARLAMRIGALKRDNRSEVYQPARESEVLANAIRQNPGPLTDDQVRRIFVEIVSACRALERPLRIAYLGPEHTYSHEAARAHFGSSAEFLAAPSIPAVFQAIEGEEAGLGVVPVENSTEGSVTLTLDLFIETPLVIIGEILMPIRHALLARGGDPDALRRIVAHQQSLAQCRNYLAANFPRCELEAVASNAYAAKLAADHPDWGAIASVAAATAYGLTVLAENIQDASKNTTRFLVIGKEPAGRTGRDKTSLLCAIPERAGALHEALGLFARNSINLTMIQSRPQRSKPWAYLFFVDFQGHRDDPKVRRVLAALKERALFLKVLGSYPEARSVGV